MPSDTKLRLGRVCKELLDIMKECEFSVDELKFLEDFLTGARAGTQRVRARAEKLASTPGLSETVASIHMTVKETE